MKRSAAAASTLLALAAALLVAAPAAQAEVVSGPNTCKGQDLPPWMGDTITSEITIPSLTRPYGIDSWDGVIARPADAAAYPGRRPVVVLQHGNGGGQCALWWMAQDLAGHGYVTLVWTATRPEGGDDGSPARAIDATRSAIAFARSSANPFAAWSDPSRTTVAGFSLGSVVASLVQADPDPNVVNLIALDGLRHWAVGDPSGAAGSCEAEPLGELTPRVPALGFAMDEPCARRPERDGPDLKLTGLRHWRSKGVPAMTLTMRDYEHTDFAGAGSEQQHLDVAWYVRAWLDRWVHGNAGATDRLLARQVNGRPTATVLSSRYRSGAYLPPRADTTDLVGWLGDTTAPRTRRLAGPKGKVTRKSVRQRGVKFRFRSEPGAKFQCKLDRRAWSRCKSPKRFRAMKLGRHTFRVRAIDGPGNVQAKPTTWRFRVVRHR